MNTKQTRLEHLRRALEKSAYTPPAPAMDPAMMGGAPAMDPSMMGGAPPMDPAMMGGAPPMDPSMMGGAPAMDPAMMGGMDPSMMGGMDPAMMGGAPPMDPSMMGGMDPAMMGGAPEDPSAYDFNALNEADDNMVMLDLNDLKALLQEAVESKGESSDITPMAVDSDKGKLEERIKELETEIAALKGGSAEEQGEDYLTPEAQQAMTEQPAPAAPEMETMPKMASYVDRAKAEDLNNRQLLNRLKKLRQAR